MNRFSQDHFKKIFQSKKTQLLWQWISGDLETPVSAYLKLCTNDPYAFLLESVEGGATLGRYSVIGFDPDLIWRYQNGCVSTKHTKTGETWTPSHTPPKDSLRQTIQHCKIDHAEETLPPMAVSGLFGYMGYDMVRLIEDIPDNNTDTLGIPDSLLIRPQMLVIFDNVKNMICLVTPIYAHAGNTDETPEIVYDAAKHRLDRAIKFLNEPLSTPVNAYRQNTPKPLNITSNMTENCFHDAVQTAKEHIYNGDIFQVVLSQRFKTTFDAPPFALYRSLRTLNPSPFMFYFAFEDFALTGSSPEILVRVRDNTVTIRPIAGTRKRGTNAAEDKALAEELLADPKEKAEHLMLLDLGRNDVGRLAEFGTVNVTEQFRIEYYSHVMHIVSNVEGRLRENLDILDALFSGFPAGTVSGAPKIRAMEIIDNLENTCRSFYGGAVGYLSGNEEMDTCIALRTALVKDNKLYVQAGAGIVADSMPDAEYQETVNKAKAIFKAAEDALARMTQDDD